MISLKSFLVFIFIGCISLTSFAHPHQYVEVELNYKFSDVGCEEVAVVWGLGLNDSVVIFDIYDKNSDGLLSSQELEPLRLQTSKKMAEIRAFGEFSLDGKKTSLPEAVEPKIFVEDERIFYSFRLPIKIPIISDNTQLKLSYYDKSYFTEIVLSDQLIEFENANSYDISAFVAKDSMIALLDGSINPYFVQLTVSRAVPGKTGAVEVRQEEDRSFGQLRKDIEKQLMDKFLALKRNFKESGSLKWYFIFAVIAFLYGLLHAAGPGHGKAVVSSYLLSGNYKLRSGIMLSFLIAWMHAVSGVVFVLVLRSVLTLTIQSDRQSVYQWTTAVSFSFVFGLGLFMLVHAVREWRGREKVSREDKLLEENPRSPLKVAVLLGLVPCPATVTVMTFALAMKAPVLGITMVVAQALGMGVTIAMLSSVIIGSRTALKKISCRWVASFEVITELFASLLIIIFSAIFLLSTLKQLGII